MPRIKDHIRRFVLWAMLSPFLMLALIPSAVMPARTMDDGITFILCSDHGPVQMVIDPATGQPVKKQPAGPEERCAWATAHVAAVEQTPAGLPALMPAVTGRHVPVAPFILIAARATGRPPATGPPLSV